MLTGPVGGHGEPNLDASDETRTVAEVIADTDGAQPAAEPAAPAQGTDILGRYTILEEVGAGGMGVVLAAYDRVLDRKVALKLLRRNVGGEGQRRMLQEAQALARLSHPNVVKVFDVGTYDARVYIAMEYIEGETLEAWARRAAPTWREILTVVAAAGRGLAAAHAAGLVHRDFKPSNVLVGASERGPTSIVRVVDFGIAITTDAPSPSNLSLGDSLEVSGAPATWHLTQTGAVMGTPAYMAPEQHLGNAVDARSDQFSFCVTAYRVLYGERPFEGRSLREIRQAVLGGVTKAAPVSSAVPAWVRRALLRGMSVAPARRWPSMHALLEVLERRGAARPWLLVGAVGVTSAVGLALWARGDPTGAPACDDAVDRLQGVWDASRQTQVVAAFGRSELPYAADTLSRVGERLDRYAGEWGKTYAAVCAGGSAPDAPHFDARMGCLRGRVAQLEALTTEFTSADDALIERATQAVAALQPVRACAELEAGEMVWPVADDARTEVEAIERSIAAFDATQAAGRYERAVEVANDALSRATTLGHTPLMVDARWRRGIARAAVGEIDEGVADMTSAAYDGIASRHDEGTARAATRAAFTIGYRQARYDEASVWARTAEAALDRLGRDTGLRSDLLEASGAIAMGRGDFAKATEIFEAGLRLRVAEYGDDHDKTAVMLNNLAGAMLSNGEADLASQHLERAIAIWKRVHGPGHPHIATTLNSLAVMYEAKGDFEAARRTQQRAIELKEVVYGPEHDSLAVSLDNLGSVLVHLGEYEAGRDSSLRSLRIREKHLGPDHPYVGSSLVNIGLADEYLLRDDDAADEMRRAQRIFEQALGPEHRFVAYPLTSLGRIALRRGEVAEALALLQRARQIRARDGSEVERAETAFALGRARWADGVTDEAHRSIVEVRAEIAEVPSAASLRAEIDTWLQTHAAP
jgi:tetratricopeptide (TPR) repeat protein